MALPESAGNPGGAETAVRNLREQVRTLELLLLRQRAALEAAERDRQIFAAAAEERLRVIERGDQLLQARDRAAETSRREIAAQAGQLAALQSELAASVELHEQEKLRLEMAKREWARGMEELANRERTLTEENLVLRNQGLINSIIARLRRIFS